MKKQHSFTLIELLVVIAIVGILAAIIFISLGDAQNSAYDARRKVDINQLSKAIMIHLTENPNEQPPTGNCNISSDCPSNISTALGDAATLKDPQETKSYTYSSDGSHFIISTELAEERTYCFRSDTGRYVFDDCAPYGGSLGSCPTGWIEIPGTNNCTMKYEAKISGNDDGNQTYDPSFIADSRPSGTPWVNITQQQAKDECAAIGAHLMTNAEWMTIAGNIENNPTPNTVNNYFYIGNSDETGTTLSASSNDNDGYYGTGESAQKEWFKFSLIEEAHAIAMQCEDVRDPVLQKRTFKFSNGETIWDLSGNVSEILDTTINITNQPESATSPWDDHRLYYEEFNTITDWKGLNPADFLPQNTSFTNLDKHIGTFTNLWPASPAILVRGGDTLYCESAGLYHTYMHLSTDFSGDYLGFRCVKPKS